MRGAPLPGQPLRFAYNTNGMAHHRLGDALDLLAHHGYAGVALTLDHGHLDPFAPDLDARTAALSGELEDRGLDVMIETGARFLMDPGAKHEPTLVTADAAGRARRVDFLTRALDVAAGLRAEAVSFWAGVPAARLDREQAWGWLVDGVGEVLQRADERGVTCAFEPEPGMLVEHTGDYQRLVEALAAAGAPDTLGLALDTGHCVVAGDLEPQDAVRAWAPHLRAVAVEGMARGVHEHLPIGEGDVDVPAVLAALREVGYERLVSVELSRDSHRADVMVPATMAALRAAQDTPETTRTPTTQDTPERQEDR